VDDQRPGIALRREFFDVLAQEDVVRLEIPIHADGAHGDRQTWMTSALIVSADKTTGEITARIGMRTSHGKPAADRP
jgi:hypothetical protein